MTHCCSDMQMMIDNEESIVYIPEFREYGIPIRDGGVLFCLWNIVPGAASNSRKLCEMNFFDILEEAGIDYPDEKERVPENMRSDKWWRDNEKYN